MSPGQAINRVCRLAAALEDRRMPALEQLDQLTEILAAGELARSLIIERMRERSEATWRQVGAAMGVTPQAAQMRYGRHRAAEPDEQTAPLF